MPAGPKAKDDKPVKCGFVRFEASREDAQVKIDGEPPLVAGKKHKLAWTKDNKHLEIKVPVGKHKVEG